MPGPARLAVLLGAGLLLHQRRGAVICGFVAVVRQQRHGVHILTMRPRILKEEEKKERSEDDSFYFKPKKEKKNLCEGAWVTKAVGADVSAAGLDVEKKKKKKK